MWWFQISLNRTHIRYLSPIVVMELTVGIRTAHDRKIVDALFEPYFKAKRIIPINSVLYYKVGECLASLAKRYGKAVTSFSHDILIALSAFSMGSTLFTSNRKDFEKISKIVPVRIEYV